MRSVTSLHRPAPSASPPSAGRGAITHRCHLSATERAAFPVEIVIPTVGMADTLPLIIDLFRAQTIPVQVLIIDTGSRLDELRRIEALRAADVEVHSLRSERWSHPSDPVAVALDLALSLGRSEVQLLTHADCFPMRRDGVAGIVAGVSADRPIVGYQISPRDHIDDWASMVGHTWTAIHVPTIRRAGLRWCHGDHLDRGGSPERADFDTEFHFCRQAIALGLPVDTSLGGEENYQRNVRPDFDHVRSLAGARLYSPDHKRVAEAWLADAIAAARARLADWTRPPSA